MNRPYLNVIKYRNFIRIIDEIKHDQDHISGRINVYFIFL